MTPTQAQDRTIEQVPQVLVTKTCEVNGKDGKPALRMTLTANDLRIELLPKQGQRRAPVRVSALRQALDALEGQRQIAERAS